MIAADAIQRAEQALEDGRLFAHMFEFNPNDRTLFFELLNGASRRTYESYLRTVYNRPDGYGGLASTGFRKGVPISLCPDFTPIGIIFDGNSPHVKPLHVCSHDSSSKVAKDSLTFANDSESPAFARLTELQGGTISGGQRNSDLRINMQDAAAVTRHVANANAALAEMWRILETTPRWKGAILETNEVNLIAHLKGVCGLIIDETTSSPDEFGDRVKQILETRTFLGKQYPDIFQEPLPVFSYNPRRLQQRLMAMTEAQLQNPIDFFRNQNRSESEVARVP